MRIWIMTAALGTAAMLAATLAGCGPQPAGAPPDNAMTSVDAMAPTDAMANAADAMAIPTPPDEDGKCSGANCTPAKARP
jgi:hypothetical protein